ncbi:hypothetical protein AOXY_G12434, partial [Acipenser oxyrinchus oxyrinchus]
FPSDLLVDCLPADIVKRAAGLCTQDLLKRIDSGCFTAELNFSYNMKSGLYNIKVLKKSISLLERRFFSFDEIKEVRLSFSTYEDQDQRGMRINQRTLLRALKMCGRVIAPLKLAHRIRHLKSGFIETGRVQLYEFLDLLPLCELRDKITVQDDSVQPTAKSLRNIYKLDDRSSLLGTGDERVARHLNERFQLEERDYGTVTMASKRLMEPPVLSSHRTQQVKEAQLGECRSNRSGMGQYRDHFRATSVPRSKLSSVEKARAQTANSGWAAQFGQAKADSWTWVVPVPQLRSDDYKPTRLEPIVTEKELQAAETARLALEYDISTMASTAEERSKWDLDWKMDYCIPGYREANKERPQSVTVVEAKPVRKRADAPDVFKRLSSSTKRGPSPCHAAACNAFTLGITVLPPCSKVFNLRSTAHTPQRTK